MKIKEKAELSCEFVFATTNTEKTFYMKGYEKAYIHCIQDIKLLIESEPDKSAIQILKDMEKANNLNG